MKIFSEEDIEKNIEGFSDTKLKRFILRNGIKYKGGSYQRHVKQNKTLMLQFNRLATETFAGLIELIAFIDLLDRDSTVFKFATMCHITSYTQTHKEYEKYHVMVSKLFGYDDTIREMMQDETARLERLFKYDSIKIISIEEKEKLLEKEKEAINIGVHKSHCCFIHGCKYGDADCPVETGEVVQEFICEHCQSDDIKSTDELEAMIVLGLKKCSECGHYYKVGS